MKVCTMYLIFFGLYRKIFNQYFVLLGESTKNPAKEVHVPAEFSEMLKDMSSQILGLKKMKGIFYFFTDIILVLENRYR